MRVYIAGPMSGKPKHNFPAFDAAKERLLAKQALVVSPADLDRAVGITEDSPVVETRAAMKLMVALDRVALSLCDAIYMLKGWENSVGSRAEHAQAVQDGLIVLYEEVV